MKWREPWLKSLKRQARPRLLGRSNLTAAVAWAVGVLILMGIAVVSGKTELSAALSRAWMVPVFGLTMATLLTLAHWLSPLEVTSGPRGIVRSKGEALALIAWMTVRSYRFDQEQGERRLVLNVSYSTEPEVLYLSPRVDQFEVEKELLRYVRAEA
jgi:hypothetical protein